MLLPVVQAPKNPMKMCLIDFIKIKEHYKYFFSFEKEEKNRKRQICSISSYQKTWLNPKNLTTKNIIEFQKKPFPEKICFIF